MYGPTTLIVPWARRVLSTHEILSLMKNLHNKENLLSLVPIQLCILVPSSEAWFWRREQTRTCDLNSQGPWHCTFGRVVTLTHIYFDWVSKIAPEGDKREALNQTEFSGIFLWQVRQGDDFKHYLPQASMKQNQKPFKLFKKRQNKEELCHKDSDAFTREFPPSHNPRWDKPWWAPSRHRVWASLDHWPSAHHWRPHPLASACCSSLTHCLWTAYLWQTQTLSVSMGEGKASLSDQ